MILVNGCSFTECWNLENREQAWPNIVSKELSQPLVNLAIGGGSNSRIARTTQEWLYTNEKPDLVIIGWTSFVRNELSSYNGQYIRMTPHSSLIEDNSLHHNPDTNLLHEIYYRCCHNDFLSLKDTLRHMITMDKLLTSMGIPYIFFNAMHDNHFSEIISGKLDEISKSAFEYYAHEPVQFPESLQITTQYLKSLIKSLNHDSWLWWPDGTYCKNFNFCARDSSGHFLEQGNLLMAKTLLEFL